MHRMIHRLQSLKALAALLLLSSLLLVQVPLSEGAAKLPTGYESVSYGEMVPIDKVTLIDHDREGSTDDLAFLAEVPASVFRDPGSGNVLMNPLLFYEPPRDTSDVERVQNTYPAVSYFMEDMQVLAGSEIDKVELVGFDGNTPAEVGGQWTTSRVTHIDSKDPYSLSGKVALENWEYSDTAVVAVIVDRPKQIDIPIKGELTGTTPGSSPSTGTISGEKDPSPINPNTHPFNVEPDFKYVTSQMTWGQDWNPLSELTDRGKDPDLQLYDMQLGMVGASEKWNVLEGASEEIGSYIYHSGEWQFAVTYMPTQNSISHMQDPEGWGGVPPASEFTPSEREQYVKDRVSSIRDSRLREGLSPDAILPSTVKYTIDYTLYPGIDVQKRISTPFYCRDATFKLEWSDASQTLGLILRGPEGAEIAVSIGETTGSSQVIEVPELGQGDYQVSVVNLGTASKATDFKVTYEFKQRKDGTEGASWAGATNGAVIATALNAPLLFAKRDSLPDSVGKAINTLGVRKLYVVDPAGMGTKGLYSDIDKLRGFVQGLFGGSLKVTTLDSYEDVYGTVKELTMPEGDRPLDIVFTTINPWTSWQVLWSNADALIPRPEVTGALFLGPAALAAAVHGAPVFVTDVHPELSTAQAWHNKFWDYAYSHSRAPPSVACMALTAKSVYSVLDRYGFDRKSPIDENGKCKESIITVADQFDIGTSWDRALVGGADSGRIMGTPVDTAAWVSRSALYPKLIYANPAVDPELDSSGGMRIQGSESTRTAGALRVTTPEREEKVDFPVAMTWVSYQYKFNQQASEYWGCAYTTRTGITPYFDMSNDGSDPDGIDPEGRYPDLDCSEVIPHYLDASGYGSAYTTTFEKTTENLNRGAIMWLEVMHGGHTQNGAVGWWDERGAVEENPWRGYEEAGVPMGTSTMRLRGATDNPDVVTMSKHIGLDVTPGGGPITPADIVPERHDGIIIAIAQQGQTEYSENGIAMDDAFGNLHSMGFSAGSCLIANTYLHLMMVRKGCVFQVIDPWLTSWYSAFAMNMFMRDIYYDRTIGDAYERGISHVGIEYLIDGWWWDIFENLVYYGDPDIKVFSPKNAWEEPAYLNKGTVVSGHAPFGSSDHPRSMGTGLFLDITVFLVMVSLIGAAVFLFYRSKKGYDDPVSRKLRSFLIPRKEKA